MVITPRKNIYNEMVNDLLEFKFDMEYGWRNNGGGIFIGNIMGYMKEEYLNDPSLYHSMMRLMLNVGEGGGDRRIGAI